MRCPTHGLALAYEWLVGRSLWLFEWLVAYVLSLGDGAQLDKELSRTCRYAADVEVEEWCHGYAACAVYV